MSLRITIPLLLSCISSARADVRMPALFGDHMVLQRETSARVWGWADPGEAVAVRASWSEQAASTVAADDGSWSVHLQTPEAGGPHTLTIQGQNTIELADVYSGEVWVCSGQSNMEWGVASMNDAAAVIADANCPQIRLFNVAHQTAKSPEQDAPGSWAICTPETVPGFSAVGYGFGRILNDRLQGVPIGLIGSNWGGTVAEAWTSAEGLSEFPEFDAVLAKLVAESKEPKPVDDLPARQSAWWERLSSKDQGMQEGWMAGELQGSWSEASVPLNFDQVELGAFDGLVWFRREVTLGADLAGQDLVFELGPVDDMDIAYWDGEPLGSTQVMGQHRAPREYALAAERASAGTHVLCVAALDTGGAGIFGQAGGELHAPRVRAANLEASQDLAGVWQMRVGSSMQQLGAFPSKRAFSPNTPTALSNGMLEPLTPFSIRGAIWYQGESNRTRAEQYQRLFPAMIADWRRRFDQGDFPFYFVQIAPFNYGGDTGQAAELREAQLMTLSLANTGMAVTMDVGNPTDIHPRDKWPVSARLADMALKNDYGFKHLRASGPIYASSAPDAGALRLSFENALGGLGTSDGEAPSHFQVAGADRVFHAAQAVIEGATIVLRSDAVAEPVAARYAWGAGDEPNLVGGTWKRLPVSSFRTDDWVRGQ
ncbi:MAG: sialate O-acetylesterase [Planctomycetota bacterium]|jgi:sialate O-acetylesterase